MSPARTLHVTTPTDTEIRLTRAFDATRELVFAAWTTPELLTRWFGPPGWNLVECDIDLRVGGRWRYVSRGPDGTVMIMSGEYREVAPPARLVATESFDDPWYDGEALATTEFVEVDGSTTVTVTMRYASTAVRDAVIASRMEQGAGESYERLAALLTTTRAIADRYRRVAGGFTEIVASMPADAWSNASPCAAWDARDVLRHNVDMATFVLGLKGVTQPTSTPSVDDDPHAAWLAARDSIQAALDDPVLALRDHDEHRYLGVGPWNRSADRTLTTDLIVHTWDLASAAGLDHTIDPDDMRHWREVFAEFDDATLRNPEVFGAALDPPDGADEQTRFLAFLGRRAE